MSCSVFYINSISEIQILVEPVEELHWIFFTSHTDFPTVAQTTHMHKTGRCHGSSYVLMLRTTFTIAFSIYFMFLMHFIIVQMHSLY